MFTQEPTSKSRVPSSALRQRAREIAQASGGGDEHIIIETELWWVDAMHEFNIPKAWSWEDDVPFEVRRQYVGQQLRGGMKVTYKGQECLTVLYYEENEAARKFGRLIKRAPKPDIVVLALAKFIDLQA